jgi:hypothetical protein
MPADPKMRDGQVGTQIGTAQEVVGQLQGELRELIEHACRNDAVGHERLYQAVELELDRAWKALGDAYETMMHGEAEDYVGDE